MPNTDFKEKVALIFGGANGIGRAIALEFARRGSRVVIVDIDEDGAVETVNLISESGGVATKFYCDVGNDESVREVVEAAEKEAGAVDIVVNNVGVILSGNPEDIPVIEWQRVLNLNLLSIVRSNLVFLPKMIARGSGHIVNTASFAGLYPYATSRIPYAASKAAVIALSESLAIYLLPQGINVSCYCPGPVLTGVMKGMTSWSDNVSMRGPGSQFKLMSAEEAAVILADGMQQGRIMIPTHEAVWGVIRDHAHSPDQFIRNKIAQFSSGDNGLPKR